MNISNQFYTKSRGTTVFGSNGLQQVYSQYNSIFTFISSLIPYEESINLSISQSVDSCWSSGNLFYADLDSGVVTKISYNHDILATLTLTNPLSLSVIQTSVPMDDSSPTSVDENGCWILSSGSLTKTDADLNSLVEVTNLPDPLLVTTNHFNGGCYVIDGSFGIMGFDSDGALVSSGSFTYDHVIGCLSDSLGNVFVLTETELYRFVNVSGALSLAHTFSLSSYFPSLSIGSFDIDTSNNHVYVAGGDNSTIKIVKFNSSNSFLGSSSISGDFPYILKASQHPSSNTFVRKTTI